MNFKVLNVASFLFHKIFFQNTSFKSVFLFVLWRNHTKAILLHTHTHTHKHMQAHTHTH